MAFHLGQRSNLVALGGKRLALGPILAMQGQDEVSTAGIYLAGL